MLKIELINTGSELMLGYVLNTHQQWLCRELFARGYEVQRQVAVPDSGAAITGAVKEALSRADVVITTGGLGPTSDDVTRDLIARLLHRELVVDEMVLKRIEAFFASRSRPMPYSTRVQALVPQGAIVLLNENGTAPGLVLEIQRTEEKAQPGLQILIMLPGPPRELRPMFTQQVIPLLLEKQPPQDVAVLNFKTTGLGESVIEERIAESLNSLLGEGLEVGYCARLSEVDVRLLARGSQSRKVVDEAAQIVRKQIGKYIFSEKDEPLEAEIIRLLIGKHSTVSTAESCTGGSIAHRLTNVAGASEAFWGGCVTYSNEAKRDLLGVRAETIENYGAVSEETAREMAEGMRKVGETDYALAVTGIAGPTGATPGKPIGTVFIALASARDTKVMSHLNAYDRETFKFVTSQQAFELLRRSLLKIN